MYRDLGGNTTGFGNLQQNFQMREKGGGERQETREQNTALSHGMEADKNKPVRQGGGEGRKYC